MNIDYSFNPARAGRRRKGLLDTLSGSWSSSRNICLAAARHVLGAARCVLTIFTMAIGVAALGVPAWAQTADELAKQYKIEIMQQALQTKDGYDHYGLRFDSDQSAIQADAKSLLDDIATMLGNFPEWHLRIVGHTDATADPQHNEALSLERANAIKVALVERGIDEKRLAAAGAGEARPVAANDTPEGRALNRRVELVKFTDFGRGQATAQGDVGLSGLADGNVVRLRRHTRGRNE